MKKNYVLQPMESLLHEISKQLLHQKTDDQTTHLIQTIANEKVRVYNYLKAQIFNLKGKEHTQLMVQKYHHAIILLINQAFNLQKRAKDVDMNTREILEYLLISLEEIQQYLEVSYPAFLSQEKRIGLPELVALKEIIEEKILILPELLKAGDNSEKAITIVISAFQDFMTRIDREETISVKEYDYHKSLLYDLIQRGNEHVLLPDCPTLHELLLYWNFNSTESIQYFRNGLEELIQQNLTTTDKLQFMRFQFKRLLHIPVMPKTIYDKNFPSIKSHFLTWLKNEIDYLEQKNEGFTPLVESSAVVKEKIIPFKVLIALSADQIGILLRAAKDLKIFVSKSIESIFKAIIPYISTEHRVDLSWKSVMGKGYNVEDRDKRVVVEVLRRFIHKIENDY